MAENYQQLEQRVKALEKWQKERQAQQVTFPLDTRSIDVLNIYFMRLMDGLKFYSDFTAETEILYIGKQNDKNYNFTVDYNYYIPYIVDTSTNIFTANGYNFEDASLVFFRASYSSVNAPLSPVTELPSPLGSTAYYVRDSTGSTFKVATTADFGDSTSQFDITNPSGDTFRYTYDGTGTDPGITSATFLEGFPVVISGDNFDVANNGSFTIINSGNNFFEVTNSSGVSESNKTLGASGFINTVGSAIDITDVGVGRQFVLKTQI